MPLAVTVEAKGPVKAAVRTVAVAVMTAAVATMTAGAHAHRTTAPMNPRRLGGRNLWKRVFTT